MFERAGQLGKAGAIGTARQAGSGVVRYGAVRSCLDRRGPARQERPT